MKKSFCLVLVVLFTFLNCQKSSDLFEPEYDTENIVGNLNKKGGGGKPPNNDPMIHSFSIGGNLVVLNNEVLAEDFTLDLSLDLSLGNIPISFHVSHENDPIQFVIIKFHTDWNADYLYSWGVETVAYINEWDYSANTTFDETLEDYSWYGSVYPLDNDPIDTDGSHYELYDHLLTGPNSPDHYQLEIYVQCSDRSHFTSKRAFVWIDANRAPDPTFHLEDIEFLELIDVGKNKVRPVFAITVYDDILKIGTTGATVFARFTGIAESAFPTPHNNELTLSDGKAIITGPSFSKKAKGDLILTVRNVRTAAYGGYNPGANNVGQQFVIQFPIQ